MRLVRHLVCVAGVFAAAGCATAPEKPVNHNVEPLRGCWVSKTEPGGRVTGFLRLLPTPPDAPAYEGSSQTVMGAMVRDRFQFSFARDGSAASFTAPDRVLQTFASAAPDWTPPDGSWLIYADSSGSGLFLVVEAPGETLRIMTTLGPEPGPMAVSPIFEGERDGCD